MEKIALLLFKSNSERENGAAKFLLCFSRLQILNQISQSGRAYRNGSAHLYAKCVSVHKIRPNFSMLYLLNYLDF